MRLTINDWDIAIASVADAQPGWDMVRQQQFSEVWLEAEEHGPSLAMLVNGARAWLMYLRDRDGDPGFGSRNPSYSGPSDALMAFRLGNGQYDQYPAAWTLPLSDAIAVCEYFIASEGQRSLQISWHDDTNNASG